MPESKPFGYAQVMTEAQGYADKSGESSAVFFDPAKCTYHWWTMRDLIRPEESLRKLLERFWLHKVVMAHSPGCGVRHGTRRIPHYDRGTGWYIAVLPDLHDVGEGPWASRQEAEWFQYNEVGAESEVVEYDGECLVRRVPKPAYSLVHGNFLAESLYRGYRDIVSETVRQLPPEERGDTLRHMHTWFEEHSEAGDEGFNAWLAEHNFE